jgi:hypothetical protein
MRGSLTPTLGAIGAGVCLAALTPTMSRDVAPDDVYAWRWTVDTILDAQKKASRWDATQCGRRLICDGGVVRAETHLKALRKADADPLKLRPR